MTKNIPCPQPLFDNLEYLLRNDPLTPFPKAVPEAAKDYRWACNFLYSYRGSEATFLAYRREIERLLHWSWWVVGKSIASLRAPDIEAFVEFCQNPPTTWIGTKHASRFVETGDGLRKPHAEWRPFVVSVSKAAFRQGATRDPKQYSLSQKALQALFAILGSFYSFLLQENYVTHNPVAQIRQKSKYLRKTENKPVIRRLTELQWNYVIETAEQMAKQQPEVHERTLFIMTALYAMYLRISELTATPRWQPKMGDFYRDNDDHWWFLTVGKGNKERSISVSDAMLNALKRYRLSRALPPLPAPGETTPLITQLQGKTPISSTRQIRTIVQQCFDTAIQQLHTDGFKEEADQLAAATVHWLRHTGISDDVKHRPREHVRDDAGHSSSAITDKYIDVERRARHASARKKVIKI